MGTVGVDVLMTALDYIAIGVIVWIMLIVAFMFFWVRLHQ
jgi:hypothetical protein